MGGAYLWAVVNSAYHRANISNDTGPAHMAAHLGAKGVTLFGYHTTPKKVSIETNKFKAIIKDNLNELSAEEVYSNISKELSLV